LPPEEQESLRSEIESILGYVDQVKKASQVFRDSGRLWRAHYRCEYSPQCFARGWRFTCAERVYGKDFIGSACPRDDEDKNYLKVKKIM